MTRDAEVGGRSYVITGGRTGGGRAGVHVETLVSRGDLTRLGPRVMPEHRSILNVCKGPVAVAEVAARVDLPLGVVQVLVGDLVDDGALAPFHRDVEAQRDIVFLERLIARVSDL